MESAAEKYGNTNASADDVLEINAGGKVIVTKRSTLTQRTVGTKFGALFSGRWDKKLQRDGNGRIFLDVNSECFQAIVTYLSELILLSEDEYSELPSVDDEYAPILWQQLGLFGLLGKGIVPCAKVPTNTTIIPIEGVIHDNFAEWLTEQQLHGNFCLRYRYSGACDGLSMESFCDRRDKEGSFIFILQAIEESSTFTYGCDLQDFWCKRTIRVGKFTDNERKIFSRQLKHQPKKSRSSSFLRAYKLLEEFRMIKGFVYHEKEAFLITQLEVYEIFVSPSTANTTTTSESPKERVPVTKFTADINNAINEKQTCLSQTELKVQSLEDRFNEEETFINTFVSGDPTDVITLNVHGTPMVTKRSTLRVIDDSVLAQQFDDSKWTEQGHISLRVKGWSADDVCNWVNNIEGIEKDVGSIFKQNSITGCELLALNIDGLKMLGIERVGTVCLLQKEIEALAKASQDVVSLIDHCPYCFGKIIDYLRLKQIHTQGLAKEEPALPDVPKSQKQRFEKVVNFYFPGDAAKVILGG